MAAPSKRKCRADGNYSKQITIGRKPDGKPIRKTIYAKTIKELEQPRRSMSGSSATVRCPVTKRSLSQSLHPCG